jgi:3-deoxy-7-phosphoheptulonate synthase
VSREWKEEDTVVTLPNGTAIGGREIALMAGPCAVESREQILGMAKVLARTGATILRGGAFKPRTSPYSFQGLGLAGLELLAEAREATGMAVVTEAIDPEGVDLVAEYADIIQIGARNMQLCERGVRSFDPHTRNLLDLTAIPVVKALSHLPIIADPSHGTGLRTKVTPMARAAVAAGADGLMVEVHPDPTRALSDGAQSLYPEQFAGLVDQIRVIADSIDRTLCAALPDPGP